MIGSTEPRVQSPPLRLLWPRTDEAERWTWGYQVVDFAEAIGAPLLPWQQYAVVHLLELSAPGVMRWRVALLLVARQNGKTHLMLTLALWALMVARWPLVLSVAQDLSLAEEVVDQAYRLIHAEGDDGEPLPHRQDLVDEVLRYVRKNGDRALITRGGRWIAKSGGRSATRGRSADLVLMDELREQRDWETWAAIAPTRLTRQDGLLLGLSNAGDRSSVVLRETRSRVLRGLGNPDGPPPPDLAHLAPEDDVLLLEWSAPPGSDVRDPEALAAANPSLGYTITERALESALTGPERTVRTEHLCQWVESASESWIDPGQWAACRVPDDAEDWEMPTPRALGVAVDPRGEYAAIAAAAKRPDGSVQVELVGARPWWDWAAPWIQERSAMISSVSLAGYGWGQSLRDALTAAGVPVRMVAGGGIGAAHRGFSAAVIGGTLRHLGQPLLDASRAAATPREIGGDVVISWASGSAAVPLMAAVLAVDGALAAPRQRKVDPRPARARVSSSSGAFGRRVR